MIRLYSNYFFLVICVTFVGTQYVPLFGSSKIYITEDPAGLKQSYTSFTTLIYLASIALDSWAVLIVLVLTLSSCSLNVEVHCDLLMEEDVIPSSWIISPLNNGGGSLHPGGLLMATSGNFWQITELVRNRLRCGKKCWKQDFTSLFPILHTFSPLLPFPILCFYLCV